MADRAGNWSEFLQSNCEPRPEAGSANCSATPTYNRVGKTLYDTACGTMVPDLHNLKEPTDFQFWMQ